MTHKAPKNVPREICSNGVFCLGVCVLDFATIVGDSLCVNVQTDLVVNEATYLDNVMLFGSPLGY